MDSLEAFVSSTTEGSSMTAKEPGVIYILIEVRTMLGFLTACPIHAFSMSTGASHINLIYSKDYFHFEDCGIEQLTW